jgi:hypothetical protein
MVEPREIPRAYAGSGSRDGQAARRAIGWLSEQLAATGGEPLLYVPGRQNVDADPVVKRQSQQIATATWRTRPPSGWRGGPVIAAWPDRVHLADIDGDRRTAALCVIGWTDNDTDAWLAAFSPMYLDGGPASAVSRTSTDPVIEEALKTLTEMVNHANNLAGTMDKRDAIDVLQRLHDAGHRLDPDAIYVWALANGWNAHGSERLQLLATQVGAGKRPRMGMPSALRPDIVAVWREAAAD